MARQDATSGPGGVAGPRYGDMQRDFTPGQ